MTDLTALRNIGKRSAGWLQAVGIRTEQELSEAGPVEAYRRAKSAFPDQVTLNLLYALQGALLDIHWSELPPGMKTQLRREAEEEPEA